MNIQKALTSKLEKFIQNIQTATKSVFTQSVRPAFGRGFTLAEVLITLGIIGVVAAITLPPLINRYRVKQLEVAFKKSSSMIEQALLATANEYSLKSIKDLNLICGNYNFYAKSSVEYQQGFVPCADNLRKSGGEGESISNYFISQFKVVSTIPQAKFIKNNISNNYIKFLDYSGTFNGNYKDLYGIALYLAPWAGKGYILNDGSLVTGILYFYHEYSDGLSLTFDTNGPYKGPNRYGYDIFLYNTGSWTKTCSKNLSNHINGRGCYNYALKDINPDDSTKGYWESLKL